MRFIPSFAATLALALFASPVVARPQQPALPQILQRLQANLDAFDHTVPSFFADEHIVSTLQSDRANEKSITDSTFRMRSVHTPGHPTTFEESRDIKSTDGQPAIATANDLQGPSILNGAFESALAIVSLDQSPCMVYELDKPHPTQPYSIRFSTQLTTDNADTCVLDEKSKGRILVDPNSLHITHVEITTPRHTIIPGDAYSAAVIGKRILTIDYAPIQLDAETAWLPSTIRMTAISGTGTFHVNVWTYNATYANYHKLVVTHRILPDIGTPKP